MIRTRVGAGDARWGVALASRMLPPRKGGVSELYVVPGIGKTPFRPLFVPGSYPSSPAPMHRPHSSPFVPVGPHSSPC
jgi:hypothetical protein